MESGWNSGWDVYVQLRFDGNHDDTLAGSSLEPHTDIQNEYPSPGGWGGYNNYHYLVGTNGYSIAPPPGTQKGSSGSNDVQYEFKIKISDLNPGNCRIIGFYIKHGTDGTPPHDYEFPAVNTRQNPTVWSHLVLEPGVPCPGIPTVDYGGKTYNTILVCSQCWLKENLDIGNIINVTQNQTNNGILEKHCYQNSIDSCGIYGGLYQWDEMMQYSATPGNQGICPPGWHIPENDEWNQLITAMGGNTIGGGKAKERGIRHWLFPNMGAEDAHGFGALGSGKSSVGGGFEVLGMNGFFWSSTQGTDYHMYYNSSEFAQGASGNYWGLSVRCISNLDFSGANLPPASATNPNPLDNSSNVLFPLTLTWDSSDPENDPVRFDIWFGPPGNLQLIAENSCTDSILAGNLLECSIYQWQVIAKDNQCHAIPGPIWSFTTTGGDTAGITIVASANPACIDSSVTFTASPVHGGSSPVYQWQVNSINVGANSSLFTYVPGNGDIVQCTMTSSLACVQNNPATSNTILIQTVPCTFCPGVSTVSYGGQIYYTVQIGTQCWLRENLNIGQMIPSGQEQTNNMSTEKYCYADLYTNCNIYGGLYQWDEMMDYTASSSSNPSNRKGICPDGWHLPSDAEWTQLTGFLGSEAVAGGKMKETGFLHWFSPNTGATNESDFTALPGGIRLANGTFTDLQINGSWWASSESTPTTAWYRVIDYDYEDVGRFAYDKEVGFSVRCLKDFCTSPPQVLFTPCFDTIISTETQPFTLKGGIPLGGVYSGSGVTIGSGGTGWTFNPADAGPGNHLISYTYTNSSSCTDTGYWMLDIRDPNPFSCGENFMDIRDSSIYPTVLIGTQCWIATNLDFGTMISGSSPQRDNCIPEKYCLEDNPARCAVYSALYQWDEVMNYEETPGNRGICPSGWHVPSISEWNTLFSFFSGAAYAATYLRWPGTSGFHALLSGVGHNNQSWNYLSFATFFWSSSPHSSIKAWSHGMNQYDPGISLYPSNRNNAFSLRCIHD